MYHHLAIPALIVIGFFILWLLTRKGNGRVRAGKHVILTGGIYNGTRATVVRHDPQSHMVTVRIGRTHTETIPDRHIGSGRENQR